MAGTAWLNKAAILGAVRRGIREGLDESGERIAIEAKRRAPIRKVFKEKKGYRRRFRSLTDEERSIAIRMAERYYTQVDPNEFKRRRSVAHLRSYARVQLTRRDSANSLANSGRLRRVGVIQHGRFKSTNGYTPNRFGGAEPSADMRKLMTSRGAYEVRSGRAIHTQVSDTGSHVRVQVGGALKASIASMGAVQTAQGFMVKIVATIYYAKYVEFPTIRTAAQPFLLPALHQERSRVVQTMANAIRAQLGG